MQGTRTLTRARFLSVLIARHVAAGVCTENLILIDYVTDWTDQGIRAVKDSPKRSEDARELAKKVGVEIKHLYLTSGDTDLVIFVDAPSGDNVANSRWRLAHLGMCAPAPFAHGQQMNAPVTGRSAGFAPFKIRPVYMPT